MGFLTYAGATLLAAFALGTIAVRSEAQAPCAVTSASIERKLASVRKLCVRKCQRAIEKGEKIDCGPECEQIVAERASVSAADWCSGDSYDDSYEGNEVEAETGVDGAP